MPDATNRNRRRATPVLLLIIISWGAVSPLWFSTYYYVEFEPKSTGPATLNRPHEPVPCLGVLLTDTGTHCFRTKWLQRVVDHFVEINYNLIHFCLTNGQTFNVLLDSNPELVFPTSVKNPNLATEYSSSMSELRELTSIPLNVVTHPELRPILLHTTKNRKSFHGSFGIVSFPLSLFFPLPSRLKPSPNSVPLPSLQNPARLTFRISHEWFPSRVVVVSVGLK
jgi:hypothetical protein